MKILQLKLGKKNIIKQTKPKTKLHREESLPRKNKNKQTIKKTPKPKKTMTSLHSQANGWN